MVTGSDNVAGLAVLIDADNAQPAAIEALLAEVAKFGTAHVKRAYGDWTGTSLKGWKDQLLTQSWESWRFRIWARPAFGTGRRRGPSAHRMARRPC